MCTKSVPRATLTNALFISFAFPDECGTWEPINVAEHLKEMSIFVALASFFCVCKSFFALSYLTCFYIFRHAFINPFQWQTIESMRILSTNCKYLIHRNWKAPLVWICRRHISFILFHNLQAMRCNVMSNCDHIAEEPKSFRREWLR